MQTLPILLLGVGLLLYPQAAPASPEPESMPVSEHDGTWTGTTGQGKTIRFTVAEGKIGEFSVEGTFAGPGCSTTSTVRSNLDAPISGGTAGGSVRSGPGGVSFTFRATFTSPATAEGSVLMELHRIPGPPPGVPGHVPSCSGVVDTRWKATKEGASAEEIAAAGEAAAPPCPVLAPPAAVEALQETAEDEPTPGTTRFYLIMNCSYGSCYLSTSPSSQATMSGLSETTFSRRLVGDMEGTTYKFGLMLRSNNPRRTYVHSKDDPPGKLLAEVVLRQGADETVLASATFDTGPSEKRYSAVVSGPDPPAKAGDHLLVRTKWVEGANSVYTMGHRKGSWVEVPQTPIEQSPVDLRNMRWRVTGQVVDSSLRPQAGKRVMFYPFDPKGDPFTNSRPSHEDGRVLIYNPRPATDGEGGFRVRLGRGFFSVGGGESMEAEAAVVEECGECELCRVSEPVRFTVNPETPTLDLGRLVLQEQ